MPHKSQTNIIVLSGFTLILVIIAMTTAIWLAHISTNKSYMTEMVTEQKISEFIFDMWEAVKQRAISLSRRSVLEDPNAQADRPTTRHFGGTGPDPTFGH